MEHIELKESRDPRDIDVVSFLWGYDQAALNAIAAADPDLRDRTLTKTRHKVDHLLVFIDYDPLLTVEATKYWFGLFSHRRDDIWKGLLRIELNTPGDDAAATATLTNWKVANP